MEIKFYIISKIEGEYATLTDESSREELFIAMALLPLGVDIGTRLKFENMEFSIEAWKAFLKEKTAKSNKIL